MNSNSVVGWATKEQEENVGLISFKSERITWSSFRFFVHPKKKTPRRPCHEYGVVQGSGVDYLTRAFYQIGDQRTRSGCRGHELGVRDRQCGGRGHTTCGRTR
jgi:hypothetical protein